MVEFKPLSNYIVIENIRDDRNQKIITPETVKQPMVADKSKNLVVTISNDVDKDGKFMVRNVKVGDNVLLSINVQHTGQVITINKKDYIVIRENDVLGIVTGEEEEEVVTLKLHKAINPGLN